MNNVKSKKYEIDMTSGPLFSKLLVFSLPLIASGMLQLLFNAADVVVVGRFAGSEPLAAVGSTSSLTNLLVNLFMGLSVGANVVTAYYYGAKRNKEVSETVHTSVGISLVAGLVLAILGVSLAKPMLTTMGTPEDVIKHSVLYMRIYFMGMPVMMLYNFGSAILRAVGDTKRPLYYLSAGGVVNVILNLIFVIVFKMGVAGVAIATVTAQLIAAVMVIKCLIEAEGAIKLDIKKIRIHPHVLKKIVSIGIPAGVQGMLFSLSNVVIQSTVNSFGSIAMAGNTAGQNIEGFVYIAMNSVAQTAISFVGQNFGAKDMRRVRKVAIECMCIVTVLGLVLGNLASIFSRPLIGLYSVDPEVVRFGMDRLAVICTSYCLCGMMDTLVGCLRGMGHAVIPTVFSLLGACALRIIYIMTLFPYHRSLTNLYLTYPVSWFITGTAQLIYLIVVYRRHKAEA